MSLEVKQEHDALADDLFNAAFDKEVKGAVEPETKVDLEAKAEPETKVEPEAKVEPETKVESVVAPVAAPIDFKALVTEVIAATKPVEPAKVVTPAGPTAEELAAEAQYRKDWPEHAAREDRLKAQLEKVENLLAETTKTLQGQIAPAVDAIHQTAEEKHYNTIYAAHADAETIYPKVQEWITKQPKFLQPQYNSVLENGAASDIVDLFTLYKEANPATETPAGPTAEELAAEAARTANTDRLKRMATPTSIRTSQTAEEDSFDFDSAFDAEAKKLRLVA